jgi:hypothetical protein
MMPDADLARARRRQGDIFQNHLFRTAAFVNENSADHT